MQGRRQAPACFTVLTHLLCPSAKWSSAIADRPHHPVEVAVWQDLSARSLGPIGDALTTLLDAGRAIRADVDARDVILLIGYLTRLDRAEWDARARRLLNVVLDGLRRRE
jgi:hypothetical protein